LLGKLVKREKRKRKRKTMTRTNKELFKKEKK